MPCRRFLHVREGETYPGKVDGPVVVMDVHQEEYNPRLEVSLNIVDHDFLSNLRRVSDLEGMVATGGITR